MPALPAPGRLKTRREFLRVAKFGRRWASPGLVLQAARNDMDDMRVGFTVSKKVGNAVVRNRARRRLRAVAAELLARHARPGRDYVLIGRAGTPARPFTALRGDLLQALERTDSLREPAAAGANRENSA